MPVSPLLLLLEVWHVKPTHRKSLAGNLVMWSDLNLDPSFKVKRGEPNLKVGVGRVQIIRVDYSQIKTRLDIEHSRGLVSTSTGNDIQYGGSRKQKKYKGKSFESLELVIVST